MNKIPSFECLRSNPISLSCDKYDVDMNNGTVKLLTQLKLTDKNMVAIYIHVKSKNEYIGKKGPSVKTQKIYIKIQV